MSKYLHWIEHKGQQILLADYSGIQDEDEYIGAVEELEAEFLRQPPGQVILLLVDTTNSRLFKAVTDRSKQLMENAKKAGIPDSHTSLVGLSGLQKAVVQTLRFVRRDLHVAESREESMDWLAGQVGRSVGGT